MIVVVIDDAAFHHHADRVARAFLDVFGNPHEPPSKDDLVVTADVVAQDARDELPDVAVDRLELFKNQAAEVVHY